MENSYFYGPAQAGIFSPPPSAEAANVWRAVGRGTPRHTALAQSQCCAGRSPPCRKTHPLANSIPRHPGKRRGDSPLEWTSQSGVAGSPPFPPHSKQRRVRPSTLGGMKTTISTCVQPRAGISARAGGMRHPTFPGRIAPAKAGYGRWRGRRTARTASWPRSPSPSSPRSGSDPSCGIPATHPRSPLNLSRPSGAHTFWEPVPGASRGYTLTPRLSSGVPPGREVPAPHPRRGKKRRTSRLPSRPEGPPEGTESPRVICGRSIAAIQAAMFLAPHSGASEYLSPGLESPPRWGHGGPALDYFPMSVHNRLLPEQSYLFGVGRSTFNVVRAGRLAPSIAAVPLRDSGEPKKPARITRGLGGDAGFPSVNLRALGEPFRLWE